jgi:uncharacterized protein
VIKTAELKAQTRRELADMARDHGVPGWHTMRKEDLIAELQKVQRRLKRQSATPAASRPAAKLDSVSPSTPKKASAVSSKSLPGNKTLGTSAKVLAKSTKTLAASKAAKEAALSASCQSSDSVSERPIAKLSQNSVEAKRMVTKRKDRLVASGPVPKLPESRIDPKTARIRAQLRRRRETMQRHRDLSTATLVKGAAMTPGVNSKNAEHHDRVVLMVRDTYWLQATWEITQASVQRAQVSLSERWHLAQPTLRLLSIGDVDNGASEIVLRDIPVHGGVNNWYIDVDEPSSRFRVQIGYSVGDEFHAIGRSNVVETPGVGECERIDENWSDIAEDYERIYSLSGGYDSEDGDLRELFEERMHRSMPFRGCDGQTVSDPTLLKQCNLPFAVEAELIVFGKSQPGSVVSISGNPIKTKSDGSFTVRMKFPDKRQVLPVTAESQDGLQQRTTVIAVERNTKVLEAVSRDELFQ